MTMNECAEYWEPACKAIYGYYDIERKQKLGILLGTDEYYSYATRPLHLDTPMPEWLKELCVALAGPHGPTVLKIYQIKKGLPHDKKAYVYLNRERQSGAA